MSLETDYTTVPGQAFACLSIVGPECPQKNEKFGIKIRGAFATRDEAANHAKRLQKEDGTFDIYVVDLYKWLLIPPDSDKIEDVHYSNEKLEEIMFAIPMACRDPFNTLEHRMRRTLDLYKYDTSGKGLMHWAMAQTGMDDPLTRFNRTELEVYFKQYSFLLKKHLLKLLREFQDDKTTLKQIIDEAPSGARQVVSELS